MYDASKIFTPEYACIQTGKKYSELVLYTFNQKEYGSCKHFLKGGRQNEKAAKAYGLAISKVNASRQAQKTS